MNLRKAFILMFIVVAFVFAISAQAFANERNIDRWGIEGVWEVEVDRQGETSLYNPTTGEIIAAVWRIDENGDIVYLDLVEYADFLNADANSIEATQILKSMFSIETDFEADFEEVIVPHCFCCGGGQLITRYIQTSRNIILPVASRVTPFFVGPTNITTTNSVSFSESFTAGLSVADRRLISAGASFTWNTSASSQSVVGATWAVPQGRTGHVEFSPVFDRTNGRLELRNYQRNGFTVIGSRSVFGDTPRRVNGHADGTFRLVLR